jgi:hypothetical protein
MTTQRPSPSRSMLAVLTVIVVVQTLALVWLERRTAHLKEQMEQARLARKVDLNMASQLLLAEAVIQGDLRLDAVHQTRLELDTWLQDFIEANEVGPHAAQILRGLHTQHLDRWTEIWLMQKLAGPSMVDQGEQMEHLSERGRQAARMILGEALGDQYTEEVTAAWGARMGG